jgi:hypothetical protein
MVMLSAHCGQSPLRKRFQWIAYAEGQELAYKMVAERDGSTVKVERESPLIMVAKARIWASEGWQVVITDADGKSWEASEFEDLLAAA